MEKNYTLNELNHFLNHISNTLDMRGLGASEFLKELQDFFKDNEDHQERLKGLSEAFELEEVLKQEAQQKGWY
jgi:hypothetical protein